MYIIKSLSLLLFCACSLFSCANISDDKSSIIIDSILSIDVLDTIKIPSNSFIQFVDYSSRLNSILLFEWETNRILIFDLETENLKELQLLGRNKDQAGEIFAAGSFFDDDTSIFFSTERGYFKYGLESGNIETLFEQHKDRIFEYYRWVIPFGNESTFLMLDVSYKNESDFGGDYNSLAFFSTKKYLNKLDLKNKTTENVIGLDPRSIQRSIDEEHRFFTDGAPFFASYGDRQLAFLTNADTKVFIHDLENIDNPRMINYRLERKYREPLPKVPLQAFDYRFNNLRNGQITSLVGTENGDIIICYLHGDPEMLPGFQHTLESSKVSCIAIEGTISNEVVTHQSTEALLPQGISGLWNHLHNDLYLLANDSQLNEQEGVSYFYLASMKINKL